MYFWIATIVRDRLSPVETQRNHGLTMKALPILSALALMSLFGLAQAATVYRCTDAKDMVQNQLTPCAPGERQEIIGADGKTAVQRAQAAEDATNPFDWAPRIGMTKAEVERAVYAAEAASTESYRTGREKYNRSLGSWLGYTPHVNRTLTASGTHEQWVFGEGRLRKYLYIENDVVTAVQDTQ